MQLVFPDDEAVQPHLKLLALAKRWKKGQDEVAPPTTTTDDIPENNNSVVTTEDNNSNVTTEDDVPLPESRIDDEEMNDES
jgi:hypothetical protein